MAPAPRRATTVLDASEVSHRFDVFISYARDDDEAFVKKLHGDLTARGVRVWWDRKAMESRGLTFLQEIRDAIAGLERVVLVVGPRAVRSEYVGVEWAFALDRCKVVVPVLRLGDKSAVPTSLRKDDYALVPAPLAHFHVPDFRDDGRYSEALDELIRILTAPLPPLASVDHVDPLPPHFRARPALLKQLREAVVADAIRPVVVTSAQQTVALEGMGGVGKSVIAAAFGRACETRRAFSDGVLWIRIGRRDASAEPDAVALGVLGRIAQHVGAPAAASGDLVTATSGVARALADRRCLIILDDVWDVAIATTVSAVAGQRCRVIVTTRDASIAATLGAAQCPVDLLDERDALELLAHWTNLALDELPPLALDLVRECGRLALAVAMVGAMLRGRPANRWDDALARLKNADLGKIRRDFPTYPYPDLLRAIAASVDALEPAERQRYLELAVFPEDATIPEATLEVLWSASGLDPPSVHDLVDRFVDRSLARRVEGGILLHDLQRDFVVRQASPLGELHRRLVQAYRSRSPKGFAHGPRDGYFFERLPWHLREAGLGPELEALLGHGPWLQAKMAATDVNAAIADYGLLPTSRFAQITADALRLSAHALTSEPSEVFGQLLGRIPEGVDAAVDAFRARLAVSADAPWLRPLRTTLALAGAPLRRTVPTHQGHIEDFAVTPDFTVGATGASERTGTSRSRGRVRTWDLATGSARKEIDAHPNTIEAIAITADGRTLLTAGRESVIRLWDVEHGTALDQIPLDFDVTALRPFPDGRRVLCHGGKALAILDLGTHALTEPRPAGTGGCQLSPDGRYTVLADWGGTVQLLEIGTWRVSWSSANHAQYGTPMAIDRAGKRVFVAERDRSVALLDLQTGKLIDRIRGEPGDYPITALATAGDLLLVGMNDGAFQLRSMSSAQPPVTFHEHENRVIAIRIGPDDSRAATASLDGTLKLWDLAQIEARPAPRAHKQTVMQVALAPDGTTAVTVSGDGTLATWDMPTGSTRRVADVTDWLNDVAILPDGRRALTAQSGATVRLWDLESAGNREKRHKNDETYQALTLVRGGRQAVTSWQVDDLQDQVFGLAVWDVESLQRIGSAVDGAGTRRPLHGYRLAWSEETQLGFSPNSFGVTIWRIDGNTPVEADHIPCEGAAAVVAIPGTFRIGILRDDVLEIWNVKPRQRIASRELGDRGTCISASVQTLHFAVGCRDGRILILDGYTLTIETRLTIDARPYSCAIARDGRTVVVGDVKGRVHLFAVER